MVRDEQGYWDRRKGFSRRRFLQAGAVTGVGAVGVALVGCGDDDDEGGGNQSSDPTPTTQPAAGQPVIGGRLQELNTSEPD